MKRGQTVLTALVGAVPLACGMLVSVCTFTTTFDIGFSLIPLILFCAVGALLLSFWMVLPKYGFGFGALFLAGVILLAVFCSDRIKSGAIVFFCGILRILPDGLKGSFDTAWYEEQIAAMPDRDLCVAILLMIVAAAFGVLLAYTLLHGKATALPLLVLMPTCLSSFIYTDLQPAPWTIVLLVVVCGYAIMGAGFKKGESPQRWVFLTALAPILLLLCALIYFVFPPASYKGIPEETRQKVFSDLFGDVSDRVMKQLGNSSPDEIVLDAIQNREVDSTVAFSVRANKEGNYHLRVHSYGAYAGNRWRKVDPYGGSWSSMEALGNRQSVTDATLHIKNAFSDERIVPYAFRASDIPIEESRIRAKAMRDYSWEFTKDYSIAPHEVSEEERAYYEYALTRYTIHDERFARIAEEAGIRPPESTDVYTVYDTAWNVAEYVRNSGVYTHTPPKTPEGSDFILYFLTESREGYCVHFASATTAILQSLGIPARYTSGYYVAGVSGEWLNVDGNAKHAWTEIYLCGVGWIPIESTPPFPDNPPLENLLPHEDEPEGPSVEPTDLPASLPPIVPTPTPGMGNEPDPSEPMPDPSEPNPDPFAPIPETPVPVPDPNEPEPNAPSISDEPVEETTREIQSARNGAWWLLLLIPVLPATWAGICILVRKRREAVFCDPDVRRSIPEMAYYLKRLQRYGAAEDPDAERWAIEAVFSDHPMKEEQKELRRRVHAAQMEITRNNPFRRFMFRWVLFIT